MTGPLALPLSIEPDLTDIVRLAWIRAEPVTIGPSGAELTAETEEVAASLEARHAGRAPSDIEDLAPARALYRAFGIDPTRTRPSSEALLRRVLAHKPLPRICNAVDLCNLLALRFMLPLGLYDAEAIRGAVILRRGEPGEWYRGIRKEEVHLEERPVLADRLGPFGNPTSDSLRTSVTDSTRSVWMVIFAPRSHGEAALAAHAETARAGMVRHLGGSGAPVAAAAGVGP